MSTITPRWEWRSFGQSFGGAERRLAALPPQGVQESDELYLLTATGANVKVRAALMDIKALKQVNGDGLEQWIPVMKVGFPLPAAETAKVLEALRLAPAPPRAIDSLDQFIDAFVTPGGAVRVVKVHKRRTRYMVGGCMSEFSEVVANGTPTRTIAVESEDAAAVIRAVRELGLGGYTNTSYPRGLAALVDGAPARFAVIDVGTNSVKFHVGEREPGGGGWRTVVDRSAVTRLGEGFGTERVIGAAALERTAAAIEGMVAEARQHGVLAIAAVGTAGLRIAANAADAIATIRSRTGVHVEVVSGEDESRLAYLAAKSGLGTFAGTLAVFDTGGGSSQFSFGHGASVDERFSVDVGAVRFTERYKLDGVVSPDTLREAIAAISADLSRLDGRATPDAVVAMGGVVTNMTAVLHRLATYDPAVVQGTVLHIAEIDRQIELYRSMDAAARREIVGLQPKREDVILAGACIVRTVLRKLGKDTLTVCDRGLRHGVLAERFAA